jgi:hypothetical protein
MFPAPAPSVTAYTGPAIDATIISGPQAPFRVKSGHGPVSAKKLPKLNDVA